MAATVVLLGGFTAGCGSATKKSSDRYPNDDQTGACVSSWNKRASVDFQSALASSARANSDKAVLVNPTATNPALKPLGHCAVVKMGTEDRPNVAFVEDSSGNWSGSRPGNPTDYESGSPLGTVLEMAIDFPNASVNSSGQLNLNYPYAVTGGG
ncbi:MAG: hypothetical protein QOD76_1732 [Solirubrobacteraceae bacterium]|nr:hypothetical protein [Solirubrobacteraceae bacterium]